MPQAGWYPDPAGAPRTLRYFDGTQWTTATRPGTPPPPAKKRVSVPLVLGISMLVLLLIGLGIVGANVLGPGSSVAPSPTASKSVYRSILPAASDAVCPSRTSSSATLTDSYITVTAPAGWTLDGAPGWTNCGGAASPWSDSDIRGARIEVGAVGNPHGSHDEAGHDVWNYVSTHYYDSSRTKAVIYDETVWHLVDDTTSTDLNYLLAVTYSGLITSTTGGSASDTLTVSVINRLDGNYTVVVGIYATTDKVVAAEVEAALGSIRVGP